MIVSHLAHFNIPKYRFFEKKGIFCYGWSFCEVAFVSVDNGKNRFPRTA